MAVARQTPPPGKLNIDHVAHIVPHIEAASAALQQAGFMLTPFSEQAHRLEPGGPLTPAGSGNRRVMLREGYLEFLTPTGDTPIAHQLGMAIQRYTGVRPDRAGHPRAGSGSRATREAGFFTAAAGRAAARDRHCGRPRHRALHGRARRAGDDGRGPRPVLPTAHAGAAVAIVSGGMPMNVAIKNARDDLKCEVMEFLLLNNNSLCLDDEV